VTPASSTNKTDHHNIAEILLKVALITVNHKHFFLISDIIYVTDKQWYDAILRGDNERVLVCCPGDMEQL
jgi:hypothetical protein